MFCMHQLTQASVHVIILFHLFNNSSRKDRVGETVASRNRKTVLADTKGLPNPSASG